MLVITGGAGFIGSNLVNFLNNDQDDEILIVEEMDTYLKKFKNLDDLKYVDCIDKDTFINDLNNDSSKYKGKFNNIFHLGACSKTTEPNRDYIISTNLEYSKDILKYSSNNKISLIYASSASVYGEAKSFIETPENESFLNHYAESKLLFDQYYRKHKDRINSQVVGLRYFNVFGPRQDPNSQYAAVIPKFFDQCLTNQNITINGTGEQTRDFTYINNVIQFNLKAMTAPSTATGKVYNVGCNENVSVIELAQKMF